MLRPAPAGTGRGGGTAPSGRACSRSRRSARRAAPAAAGPGPPPLPCRALPAPGGREAGPLPPLSGEGDGAGWRGGPAREESYNDIPGRVPLTAAASQSARAGGGCRGVLPPPPTPPSGGPRGAPVNLEAEPRSGQVEPGAPTVPPPGLAAQGRARSPRGR